MNPVNKYTPGPWFVEEDEQGTTHILGGGSWIAEVKENED